MSASATRKKHKNKVKGTATDTPTKKLPATSNSLMLCSAIVLITLLTYFPMLQHQLTNWDDELYVRDNLMVHQFDLKGIFTTPVAANYHPITMISLAINYQLSGLDPSSYLWTNLLLHLINVALVFRLVSLLTGKNLFITCFTAIVFALHPMHVESVAWVSERKDLLYTLFFLLSLQAYWRFLENGKSSLYAQALVFFLLSLLSKPAAVILPFVLPLLDYLKGRYFTKQLLIQKIPFLLAAITLGLLTFSIQSKSTVASLEAFTLLDRLLFAPYTTLCYFLRFFIPYPLSPYHPFPQTGNLGLEFYLAPIVALCLAWLVWKFRQQKLIFFGTGFFVLNLVLVSQFIVIGSTITSERYTYVPYIGLGIAMSSLLYRLLPTAAIARTGILVALTPANLVITKNYLPVWQNSGTLWTQAIEKYPEAPTPRTNRANYLSQLAIDPAYFQSRDSLYAVSFEDIRVALIYRPGYKHAFEKRALMNLDLKRMEEARQDADSLIRVDPTNPLGYDIRGTALAAINKPDAAIADFNRCLELDARNHRILSNRGSILLNHYQKFDEALQDFSRAIDIEPLGNYYLNRSICYYRKGDYSSARRELQLAKQKGSVPPPALEDVLK